MRQIVIHTPDRRCQTRVCHVNMLKLYHPGGDVPEGTPPSTSGPVVLGVALNSKVGDSEPDNEDGLVLRSASSQSARLANSEVLKDLPSFMSHLPDSHLGNIERLILDFPCLFNDVPTQTKVIEHDVSPYYR